MPMLSQRSTNYNLGLDDGYLPANLCIMGLATQLNANARTRAQAVIPRVGWTLGDISASRDTPLTIQDSPMVARLADDRGHPRARQGDDRADQGGGRPFVQGGRGGGRGGRPTAPRGANIDRTSFVMPAVGGVTLRQIVMSLQLHSSLRSINVSFRARQRIRSNRGGLNDGALPLGTPPRNLVML